MEIFTVSSNKSEYCFWDKQPFTTKPVHCPIFYKSKQVVRKKKEYYINQNVIRTHEPTNENTSFLIHEINSEKIYYDDVFCSISCCMAWIEDQVNNPKYKLSKQILINELLINGKNIPKKANHWKTLKIFGGFLSIEDFRKNTKTFEVIDNNYNTLNIMEENYQEVINFY